MTQWGLGLLLMLALPILGISQTTQTFSGAGLPAAVPSTGTSGTTVVTTNVTLNGVIGTNASVDEVAINLTHTFDGDLDISLISPAGTVMLLSGGNGGAADDYLGTIFANGGGTCIEAGTAPYTGTFEPEGGLTVDAEGDCTTDNVFATVFAGEEINGTWTLNINDNFAGDSGEIDQFDLTLTVEAPPVDPDCPFMPYDGEIGCIANVNVTLGADCTARITPQMVLTGANVDCAENIFILVDGTNSDVISGCGTHTYVAEIYDAFDNLAYTCWGNVFAEDKTDPVVTCPDDTDEIAALFSVQELSGTIDATDPSIELSDYSCFQSFFETVPGAYNYDLIEVTISTTDVYNISVDGVVADQLVVSVFSDFNADNPCENILGGTEGTWANTQLGLANYFTSNFRIPLVLEGGQTYTIMVASNDVPNDYDLGITSDNGNSVSAAGISVPRPVDLNVPLYCGDVDLIRFQTPQNWIADANGVLDFTATRNTFFGGSSAALNAFLDKVGLTGFPVVGDNCGPVLVTLSDVVVENGDCGDITLTRTFTVADRYDGACIGTPRTVSCDQTINFNRPTLENDIFGDPNPFFVLPPYTAVIECDEYFETDGSVGGPDDNPTAQFAGEPFILTASGYVVLDPTYCNLGANYSDEPRINVCDGTYKFRREWNFIDWCNPSTNFTYDQYVKVGDFTGPVISGIPAVINVSTSPFSCLANVVIPCPTIVDGNGCSSVVGTTYTVLANGVSFFAGGNLCDGDVVQAPIGSHTLIVCAEDDCGNETCEEYELNVADEIEPSAACDDELNVSIGGGDVANGIEGIARIFAADVDEGSNDNCGAVTLEVRRNYWRNETCNPSANRWSPWGDYVDFYCCDIDNEITIELRVTDESGNENICWMVITPEDKLNPYCYAPAPVSLTCSDLPLAFPGDIETAY
ncbi:proprotein convertase P-domain-containing protein, partial [Lewinella cohaerens]|uniref:proprotein convertase P-domain-containing protein n=1 Tax=Lewinella cohaerens TaxID=70995 RepID=UPI0005C6DB12